MNKKEIGAKLKILRGERTQQEVAENIGVCKALISLYESGQRLPSDRIKIRLSEFYQVGIVELFYS